MDPILLSDPDFDPVFFVWSRFGSNDRTFFFDPDVDRAFVFDVDLTHFLFSPTRFGFWSVVTNKGEGCTMHGILLRNLMGAKRPLELLRPA